LIFGLFFRVVSVFLIDDELTATSFENLIEAFEPVLRIQDVIPDPDVYLGSNNSNKRGEGKNICCVTFLGSNKFHKI
jgi:hypothetical protein